MRFVTFHVDFERKNRDGDPHPNANLHNPEYIRMIEMMFLSAQYVCPGSKLSVLTSENTDLDRLNVKFERHNAKVAMKELMYRRLLAQYDYLKKDSFSQPIMMLDSDILINKNFDRVFEKDFDVALTWRDDPKGMPINGGVIFINNKRPKAVLEFFSGWLDVYREKFPEDMRWFGDQKALAKMLKKYISLEEMRGAVGREKVVDVGQAKVLFLSCDDYNFSPDNNLSSVSRFYQDKYLLHFKGERKALMLMYFQAFLKKTKIFNVGGVLESHFFRRVLNSYRWY